MATKKSKCHPQPAQKSPKNLLFFPENQWKPHIIQDPKPPPHRGLLRIYGQSLACEASVPPPPPVSWPGRCWEMSGKLWTRSAPSRVETHQASSHCTVCNNCMGWLEVYYNDELFWPGSADSDPLLAGYDVDIVSVECCLDPGGGHSQYLYQHLTPEHGRSCH